MPEHVYRSNIPVSAEELFRWHTRRGAFERLSPPWAPVELEHFEGVMDGDRAELRVRLGPLRSRWIAEHHSYEENRQFADRQIEGPFASWNHVHRFEPDGNDASVLVDEITYELPRYAAPMRQTIHDEIERAVAYRHRITHQDLRLHRHYNPKGRRLRVAISGASGLIGTSLSAFLRAGGHQVLPMQRSGPVSDDEIYWHPQKGEIEHDKLEALDAVIHLAGENPFALRWSRSKRRKLYESRAKGTRLLSQTLAELKAPPRVFISNSGPSYYDDHGADIITEETPSRGGDFMTAVCRAWEEATLPASEAGIRTVIARMGIVMSARSYVLRIMVPVFKAGLGGRVGARDQYFPWVAMDDVLGAYYHAMMRETVEGPINVTSPHPVTMEGLTQTLASLLHRPAVVPVPSFALKALMGEVADEALKSLRIVPRRLEETGYVFQYPDLQKALAHVLGRTDGVVASQ